jgi:hypothetical protein
MNNSKNRPGFLMITVLFLLIFVGAIFILLTIASNTIATQTSDIYKTAVKTNLTASESARANLHK